MMMHGQDNVRQQIMMLVPASLQKEITCFVFYDEHPRDEKAIDIIVGTKYGEIKEFFQRSLICSQYLDEQVIPQEIKLLRSTKGDMFYLVACDSDIFILSRKADIQLHKRITNTQFYRIDDVDCTGRGILKVYSQDDAVPLIFDENFNDVEEQVLAENAFNIDSAPLLIEIQKKYTEAKHTVLSNEKSYKDLLALRQNATYYCYTESCPSSSDSLFKSNLVEELGGLLLKTKKPWIKMCNQKCVLLLHVENKSKFPLEKITVVHHSTTRECIVYTVQMYNKSSSPPYWEQLERTTLHPDAEATIAVVIDVDQLKDNISSGIQFEGVISYKIENKTSLVSFEPVKISASNVMGEEFDVLFDCNIEMDHAMLAILSTTHTTELILRHIQENDEPLPSILDLLCEHLKMERLQNMNNIVIHRKSPYHVLNGVMVVTDPSSGDGPFRIVVYSRSPSQVLALIHYMYEAVPYKIIASLPQHRIIAKSEELSRYTEDTTSSHIDYTKFKDYTNTLVDQCTIILDYLDKCMVAMNASKNQVVLDKIGSEIDIFAIDVAGFLEFRNSLLQVTEKSRASK